MMSSGTTGRNFYPRPPRGGRLCHRAIFMGIDYISIHALREEGDRGFRRKCRNALRFLSTPSARRATCPPVQRRPDRPSFLSTPSARRATCPCRGLRQQMQDFYPRPPRGGRLLHIGIFCRLCKFLSTPSARRATFLCLLGSSTLINFYPRPPRGGRRVRVGVRAVCIQISIHALREEGD